MLARRSAGRALLMGLLLIQLGACAVQRQPAADAAQTAQQAPSDPATAGRNPYLLNRQAVPKRAQEAFERAVAALGEQRWAQAQTELTALSQDYAGLSGPWLNLGIVYRAAGRSSEAATAFERAIQANANNLEAYNQLAVLKRDDGDFAAAEALYLQALAIWPAHGASHLNLGILYDIYLGRLAQAASHYQAYQALQAEPDRRVAGWLMDLQRRPQQLASTEQ